jgi:hypothetical protein
MKLQHNIASFIDLSSKTDGPHVISKLWMELYTSPVKMLQARRGENTARSSEILYERLTNTHTCFVKNSIETATVGVPGRFWRNTETAAHSNDPCMFYLPISATAAVRGVLACIFSTAAVVSLVLGVPGLYATFQSVTRVMTARVHCGCPTTWQHNGGRVATAAAETSGQRNAPPKWNFAAQIRLLWLQFIITPMPSISIGLLLHAIEHRYDTGTTQLTLLPDIRITRPAFFIRDTNPI